MSSTHTIIPIAFADQLERALIGSARERLWLSPHCLRATQGQLFEATA
jgi:hypothetical protein